jgi:hypothetical protein
MTFAAEHKRSFKDGIQYAWDATSIELAQTCMRKYYYAMVLGITPLNTSVHLVFGGLYATALEHFYKYRALGDSLDEALNKVVHEALIASWDAEKGHAIPFDHAAKTRPNLIRTIVWYVEQFGVESDDGLVTYHLADGKPAVELSFTIEASDDLLLCGHLDRVVSMGDKLFAMDQKTSGGTVGTYFFDQFSPSNQMSLYSFAGKSILNTPLSGVIIDAAQIAVNFTRFERGITTRSKEQLAEWFNSAWYTIEQARAITAHADYTEAKFPMNLASCGNYGGCPFRLLCSRSPATRPNYIQSYFKPHVWDPLKAR